MATACPSSTSAKHGSRERRFRLKENCYEMSTEDFLAITGYHDHLVPNRLRQPTGSISRLAMMLPGYGCSLDMPLFYYLENLCLETGIDVLRVETAYNQNVAYR